MMWVFSIGKLPVLGIRWSHLLTVTLTASLFMNAPGFVTPAAELESGEVLAIQFLVAGMLNPETTPRVDGNAPMSVLDVQRLLGGASGAKQKQLPFESCDFWSVAPAIQRGDVTVSAPLMVTRNVEIPRTSEEGIRQRVEFFAGPSLSRVMERYRMMLTPHAPPVIRNT